MFEIPHNLPFKKAWNCLLLYQLEAQKNYANNFLHLKPFRSIGSTGEYKLWHRPLRPFRQMSGVFKSFHPSSLKKYLFYEPWNESEFEEEMIKLGQSAPSPGQSTSPSLRQSTSPSDSLTSSSATTRCLSSEGKYQSVLI